MPQTNKQMPYSTSSQQRYITMNQSPQQSSDGMNGNLVESPALNGRSVDGHVSDGVSIAGRTPSVRCRNSILAALPQDAWQRLEPQMKRVLLHQNDIIQESGAPVRHVYFIESGMISLVVDTQDGSQVEVGVTAREGVVGALASLGSESSFHRAVVQISGNGFRLPVEAFLEECKRSSALQQLVHQYSFLLMVQASQSALCNRLHTVEERLSRWLLTTSNRVASHNLELTHEFISHMLGVRRSGVTVALGMLQQAGVIDTTRGCITILDEAKLESCACECHRIVRDEFQAFEAKTFKVNASV
jgi:CRP-like cAMP-binding protein